MAPQLGNSSTQRARIPVLVSPTEEEVVDGRRITFVWEPIDRAVRYVVQIASDTSFDHVLYEADAGRRTTHTVEGVFPIDESTYFWRVVAEDPDGARHGEANIESFISGTVDEAEMELGAPDQEEEYGPLEQLVRGARAEVGAEVTHGIQYVQEEAELGVEHEGIEAGQILGLTLAIAVALGLAILTLFQYVDLTAKATRDAAAGMSGYPELREAELQATRQLTQYGVIDSAQGV
ncbi:MAG: hypothetical protein WD275_09490, partial [Rhodothermales bacterium]